jgi:hypothetical protein
MACVHKSLADSIVKAITGALTLHNNTNGTALFISQNSNQLALQDVQEIVVELRPITLLGH